MSSRNYYNSHNREYNLQRDKFFFPYGKSTNRKLGENNPYDVVQNLGSSGAQTQSEQADEQQLLEEEAEKENATTRMAGGIKFPRYGQSDVDVVKKNQLEIWNQMMNSQAQSYEMYLYSGMGSY